MQSFRGGFGGGRGSSSSGYNFYGEHREHDGGSHDYFIGGRGRGGRGGGGGFRSRGRRGFGFGSPDKSGDGGGRSSFVKKSYSEEVQEQVEQLYVKKFKFHDEFNEWKIPDSGVLFCTGPTEPAFQIPKLLELKRNLNATKSKLDNKDMVSWTRHTTFTNRAEVVIRMLRRDFNPELCTHAWAKMQEMLWTFKVVPESMKLSSVHLCEAPGAFITSLNHYLKTHRPDCEWKWKAITLNPYFEGNDHLAMIDKDKFMSETWSHWFVGADNTGDITTWDNLLAFRESVKKDLEEVHLITADGSINCVANPSEQEATVAQLLFCETVTALALLRQKGSFILKTFTTLEHHSVCLLYILNCCFSEVHVFKPATSKAGNSEQYIICLGYKGRSNVLTHGHLDRFRAVYGKRTPPFPFLPLAAIPESFLTQLINCATKFAKYQIDVIEENVRLYDCMTFSEKQFIIEVKELTCDKFKSRCKLKKLSREKAIVEHLHLDHNHLWVVQSVQGDPLRELFSRRSVESFLTQLETRRGKTAADISSPLQDMGVGEGGPAAKKPRLVMDEGSVKAVQHLLNEIGYIATKGGDKLDDPAAVAMEMAPDEVQWLKGASSKTHNIHDQIKQLDGCRVIKVTNSRFCRHDVLKNLTEALAKSQIMQVAHIDEHEQMASHVTPGHALSIGQPPFFLTCDAVNFAALDYLVGLTGKGDEDHMLMFMDLAGAPSDFSHYLYWRRQHMVKGWGMVRVDNPKLGPGRIMEQLAPWETFQVLGPHSGVDICDNNSIKSLCAGLGNYCPGGVNLVIGDMPPIPFGAHSPGHAEYHSKRQLLSQLTCACKILSQGGTFVCRVYELLTRFSAGVVYLMYKLFEEVTILKPITSSPTSPERFLIARGFYGCQPNVPEVLLEVNGHIADLRREAGKVASEKEGDVLEILPVQLLFEEQFHRFLTLSNERIARHRVRMITLLERYFTKPELLPDGDESRELIKRGILEVLDLPENPF